MKHQLDLTDFCEEEIHSILTTFVSTLGDMPLIQAKHIIDEKIESMKESGEEAYQRLFNELLNALS